MKPNRIVDELSKVKDGLAAEAGYSVDRFLENLRRWETEHPHVGPVAHSAELLQELARVEERQRADTSSLTGNDQPPHQR